jgi:RNA-directed DNA polymerase
LDKTKPFEISKQSVWEAYQHVRANKGAAGVDEQTLTEFEKDLKGNLYKIWNRMSSGSYFPPPVKAVEIPKKSGGVRVLGVPTVADRIAQTVVKLHFEPKVEPIFAPDSYGYRPGKSAIDAIRVTRERCWRYDWIIELDIRKLFDRIDWGLLMKAVRRHTDSAWEILYIERWLKAPFQRADGRLEDRTMGTPQGGVVSPVLANLFMHYAFDEWMKREHPNNPWARYADDAVIHCRTLKEAQALLSHLDERFTECHLELNREKTRIVYCQDDDRKGNHPVTSFDFLGYTFRPRRSKNRWGKYFINFSPAVSNAACKAMRQTIRGWRIHLKVDRDIEDLSRMFNPVVRGWINYYGRFYKSQLYGVLRHLDQSLIRWVRRKYKKLTHHKERASSWLGRLARKRPEFFAHWQMGLLPTVG